MSENNRIEAFKSLNHKGSSDSLRQRRYEVTVELRKNKKDDQLFKRRNIHSDTESSPAPLPLQESNGQTSAADIPDIVLGLQSQDPAKQFESVQAVRRMLSREQNPPIDIMIQNGVVPYCVRYLSSSAYPDLQFEAAWALTNIASGNSEQTKAVLHANAVPKFVELLMSPEQKVAEQAVWALGNIAGDGPEMRDFVLSFNVVENVIKMMNSHIQISILRNIVWLCSNLCRGKNPHPPFDKLRPLMPVLTEFLKNSDEQVLMDTCWALSYVTDNEAEQIQAVLDAGAAPLLVGLLDSDRTQVLTPALRSVGNIVTGTDSQTDTIMQANVIPRLQALLAHKKPAIVKEAAWAVSNIVAGTPDQIGQVLSSGIMTIVGTVLTSGDFRSQKESAWIVTNITTGGTTEQVIHLIEKFPILKPYCDLLDTHDASLISIVLKGLENLLKLADKVGGTASLCLIIEEIGGLDKLEALQNHNNEDIYKMAYNLVMTYFNDDVSF